MLIYQLFVMMFVLFGHTSLPVDTDYQTDGHKGGNMSDVLTGK